MKINESMEYVSYAPTGYDHIDNGPGALKHEAKLDSYLTYRPLSDPITTKLLSSRSASEISPGQPVSSEFSFWTLANAYYVDSYLSSSVDKYINLVSKEGWTIRGKDQRAIDYVKLRLRSLKVSSQFSFDKVLHDIEYMVVLFANAMIVKQPFKGTNPIPGLKLKQVGNIKPVGGFFPVHPGLMQPVYDDKGTLVEWVFTVNGQEKARFKRDQVIHISYGKAPNTVFGQPYFLQALEDIRNFRQLENLTVMLLNRYIHPIIHVRKGIDGTGKLIQGKIEPGDIQEADSTFRAMTPDGVVVSGPDLDIKVLGIESQAIRAEGYIDSWRKRVFAGLATSDIAMGEGTAGTRATADNITAELHDTAKAFQKTIERSINDDIIFQLLIEGGFDPITNADLAYFEYNTIALDEDIKIRTQAIQEWQASAITHDELRAALKREPLAESDRKNLYTAVTAQQDPTVKAVDNKLRPAGQAGKKASPGGKVVTPAKK